MHLETLFFFMIFLYDFTFDYELFFCYPIAFNHSFSNHLLTLVNADLVFSGPELTIG